MQKSQTPARMMRLVAQWQRSGESGAAFARQRGIPTWTFWYWRRKLASVSTETAAPTFVPVQVASDDESWVLEVVSPSGERVQVRAGASAELVRATVAAVRTGC